MQTARHLCCHKDTAAWYAKHDQTHTGLAVRRNGSQAFS
jgi:hypothetical protein